MAVEVHGGDVNCGVKVTKKVNAALEAHAEGYLDL